MGEPTDRREPAHHLRGGTQPPTSIRPSENVETTSVPSTVASRLPQTSEMGTQTSEPLQIDTTQTTTAAASSSMSRDIMSIDSTSQETAQAISAPQDRSQDLISMPQSMDIDATEGTERTMPGSFNPTVIPSDDSTTSVERYLNAGIQFLPERKSARELIKNWASAIDTSTPILLYHIDTRGYMYFKPEYLAVRDW